MVLLEELHSAQLWHRFLKTKTKYLQNITAEINKSGCFRKRETSYSCFNAYLLVSKRWLGTGLFITGATKLSKLSESIVLVRVTAILKNLFLME